MRKCSWDYRWAYWLCVIVLACGFLTLGGELSAQIGNVTIYSGVGKFSSDLRTFSISNLSVDNHGSTTSGIVTVEVWASTQIPSIGGSTAHFLMSSYVLGTVPANYHRDVATTGTLPVTAPNPGTYWLSYALTEDRGSGPILESIKANPTTTDLGGPFFTGWDGTLTTPNTLYLGKPLSYFVSGSTASLQVGFIQNYAGANVTVRLELWATASPLRFGDAVQGWCLLSKDLTALASGGRYNNVDTGALPFVHQPPAGTYWISALLISLASDGKYYYYSSYDFPNQWTSIGPPTPGAAFTFAPTSPAVGQTVSFTDTSTGTPTTWSWTFGDGGTSTQQNPTHAYLSAGTYPVALTVSNGGGQNTVIQNITVVPAGTSPTANFTYSPSSPAPGQLVSFFDSSSGSPTQWRWTFGDGGTSTAQNPTHVYDLSGNYPVVLTVSNASGSNTKTSTLQVVGAPSLNSTYALPSSAHSTGANGAFYTTDLTIANRGSTSASVLIQFVGHDQDGRGAPQVTRVLLPGASVTYADVLSTLFGVSSGYGGIRVTSDSSSLKIVGQTSTPPPSGQGTFGQSVPALTSGSFATTQTSQSLIALRQDSAARTNAVLMNVTDVSAHVRLTLIGADASTLGSSELDLAPASMTQIGAVVTALGAPYGTKDAVLVVSTTTPGAQIACYASVIDNVTNDPRTVLP